MAGVRANRAYHLIHSRGGLGPVFLAPGSRIDRIEVVAIDDGEVVLFWELAAKPAARMLRELRTDLATLDAGPFLERWQRVFSAPHG
jgi:hypothetical protein